MEPVTMAGKCVERPIRAAKHMEPATRAKKKHREPAVRAGKHETCKKGGKTYGTCNKGEKTQGPYNKGWETWNL